MPTTTESSQHIHSYHQGADSPVAQPTPTKATSPRLATRKLETFLSIPDETPPQCCKTPEPADIFASHQSNGHKFDERAKFEGLPNRPLVRRSSTNYASALINDSLEKRLSIDDIDTDNQQTNTYSPIYNPSSAGYIQDPQPTSATDPPSADSPSNHWRSEYSKHINQRSSIGMDRSKDLSAYNFNIDYTKDEPQYPSYDKQEQREFGTALTKNKSYHSNQEPTEQDLSRSKSANKGTDPLDEPNTSDDVVYYRLKQREQHYHVGNNDFLA
ncbi:hypothetical protein WICPIJ_004273 [Wickerhamomyces pijperi]|uniref:Uncharacterized protein n=1 Tax=Wickerhamomyces pijperi TaxID=599730 RepID=A0A9P8Q680_WICPI|nr:hypothetical protein WICPIJ_004273 [Wickerhamomyces pijperi]